MAEFTVRADVAGMVWKLLVKEGDQVTEDMPVAIIESMKMEIPAIASDEGTVTKVHVQEGDRVAEHDPIVTLEG